MDVPTRRTYGFAPPEVKAKPGWHPTFSKTRERVSNPLRTSTASFCEAEHFVYRYVKGTLRGFDARDATQFKLQLPKPTDSCMTGRPRVLAAEIVEGVRSALDYIVFALSLRNNPEMKPRHPKFVIADDKASFDAQAKVALKHLGDSERAFVEALQPFSTNNSMLPNPGRCQQGQTQESPDCEQQLGS